MKSILFVLLLSLPITGVFGINLSIYNELNFWYQHFGSESSQKYHLAAEFIPRLNGSLGTESHRLDSEFSFNLSSRSTSNDTLDFCSHDARFYRAWLRYSCPQFEIRAGLQKINFGPAFILRALQWFDQLDPRDPAARTKGVEAVLARYYFLNNANLWFWLLNGKEKLKGLDIYPGRENSIETGGRIQYPFRYCEAALTYHRRFYTSSGDEKVEHRFGFDSRWDMLVGFWLELMVSHFENNPGNPEWLKYITIGADYTLPVGNGIYLLTEQGFYSTSDSELFISNDQQEISSFHLAYNLGVFDRISFIGIYNWMLQETSCFLSYQIAYDYLEISFNFHVNPERELSAERGIQIDGRSLQILFQTNF